MIKILDSDLNLLAFITDYWNDTIHEGINREYVFSCTMVIDEKSDYVIEGNIVEVEEQYFNIVHYRSYRSGNGELLVQIDCEQVAYDLIDDPLNDFIHAGTPADVLALVLAGTDFTIGTVEPTDIISVDISEVTNKRAALIQLAGLCGELKFNKYEISLYTQRGQNRGVQFRIGKNLAGIIKDVDKRSGTTQIAYDIDIIELNSLEEYEGLEYFELGDTVKIIDTELGINENQRIVEYDYSPSQRINSKVIIANFIDGIQDTITRIQTTTVVKDRLYYGTRIGPASGFESIRSDNKARGIFNADTFALQTGDGTGSNWVDAVYFDTVEEFYKFTGILEASSFVGGDIAIGSGNVIFKADAEGIYLGNAVFASAPFRVDMAGHMIAVGGEFSGEITASIITGGQINGTTITGALIQTAGSGNYPRAYMSTSGSNFGVDGSSTQQLKIYPGGDNRPVLEFLSGLIEASLALIGSELQIASDGSMQIVAQNNINIISISGNINFTTPSGTVNVNGVPI